VERKESALRHKDAHMRGREKAARTILLNKSKKGTEGSAQQQNERFHHKPVGRTRRGEEKGRGETTFTQKKAQKKKNPTLKGGEGEGWYVMWGGCNMYKVKGEVRWIKN